MSEVLSQRRADKQFAHSRGSCPVLEQSLEVKNPSMEASAHKQWCRPFHCRFMEHVASVHSKSAEYIRVKCTDLAIKSRECVCPRSVPPAGMFTEATSNSELS